MRPGNALIRNDINGALDSGTDLGRHCLTGWQRLPCRLYQSITFRTAIRVSCGSSDNIDEDEVGEA